MKTFSRLSLLTFVFLGIAFMLVGNTVYAQSLEVYTAGGQAEYEIGRPSKGDICGRSSRQGGYSSG